MPAIFSNYHLWGIRDYDTRKITIRYLKVSKTTLIILWKDMLHQAINVYNAISKYIREIPCAMFRKSLKNCFQKSDLYSLNTYFNLSF